jgi:hypothetical protein
MDYPSCAKVIDLELSIALWTLYTSLQRFAAPMSWLALC